MFPLAARIGFFVVGLMVPASAVTITFDYSHDSQGFFATNPTAKTDLDAAAAFYNAHLTDTLSAITPGGRNTWTANFDDPGTGLQISLSNLSIARNQILVFVGGFDLGGSTLGLGGPGGYSAGGSRAFLDTVGARGQAGALVATPTDFGPWGGAIQFDLNTSWYFDADPATTESFAGLNDFYSVALHEIGHVLGIGTADSWTAKASGGNFLGPASEAAFGGPVPLDGVDAHWAEGTMSTVFGLSTVQEAALTPALTTGTRKVVTNLDAAGLRDIGWTVVPEPETARLILVGLLLGAGAIRRRGITIRLKTALTR